jgi:hypothetical protein
MLIYNIANIRAQIEKKKQNNPYFATINTVQNAITDHNSFPYTRYFKGIAMNPNPIIAEREAGWRPLDYNLYINTLPPDECEKPTLLFQGVCGLSTPQCNYSCQ